MPSLKNFDLLGERPGLFIADKAIFKSTIGGIFTILTAVLSILCFAGFGQDLFQRKRPDIFLSKVLDYLNVIPHQRMVFAMAPLLKGGKRIKEPLRKMTPWFEYSLTNNTKETNKSIFSEFQLGNCLETNFFQSNLMNLSSILLGDSRDYYCVPDNFDLDLVGRIGNPIFSKYRFFLK